MDGYITIGTQLDTKSFDMQIRQLEREINEIEKELSDNKEIGFLSSREVDDLNTKLEKTKNKLIQVRNQKEKMENTSGIDKLGNSFQGLIKKAGKLALGVFGIRSAYMALRRASADLATYDPQYAANLEYIRFVLTQAIAPVLKWIVQMAGTLLGYIGAILKTLFGIDIFANSSVNAFKKMKTNAGGVSKAVKEIKKQLMSFDEANILTKQDTSSGGGGGYVAPTIDISADLSGQLPSIENIMEKAKEIVRSFWDWLKSSWGESLKKLGFSEKFIEYWENMIDDLGTVSEGIIDVIGGILDIVVGIFTGDWDKIEEGFKNLVIGIGEILGGLLQYQVDMIKNTWQGIWDNILHPIVSWIYDKIIKPIIDANVNAWNGLVSFITNVKDRAVEKFRELKDNALQIFETIKNRLKDFGSKIGEVVGGALKSVINAILSKIETQLNKPISAINSLISVINAVPGINLGRLSTIRLPRLAVGGIVNMPNRGSLIGGAIAGESGAEGIIPLTDSQAMETLGEAIGRYINLNATIPIYVGNRQIARELKRINTENDFAYNT